MASQQQFNTTATSGSDQHFRIAVSTSPVLILSASQEQRVHASIFNDSPGTLYLCYGGSAMGTGSAQQWDMKITSGVYYECPKPIYQGEIWGAWDSAAGGFARVLQLGRPDK